MPFDMQTLESRSPSRLAALAAGRRLAGLFTLDMETSCTLCGAPITAGEPCNKFPGKPTFTDYPALAVPTGTYICAGCTAVQDRLFLHRLTNVVITRDGFYPFFSNEHRSYFFLNPPDPPFLMQSSDAQMQHLVWKGRVSLSRDLYFLQFGNKRYAIRRGALAEAFARYPKVLKKLSATVNEDTQSTPAVTSKKGSPKKRAKGKPLVSYLFASLDRAMAGRAFGQFTSRVERLLLRHPELEESLTPYRQLNTGELWALGILLRTKEIPASRPALMTITQP